MKLADVTHVNCASAAAENKNVNANASASALVFMLSARFFVIPFLEVDKQTSDCSCC